MFDLFSSELDSNSNSTGHDPWSLRFTDAPQCDSMIY